MWDVGMAISVSTHIQESNIRQDLITFYFISYVYPSQPYSLDILSIPGELRAPSHPWQGRHSTYFSPVSLLHRAAS